MEFLESYKTYSNKELQRIIDNSHDYQPLAVDAAKIILSERKLTNDEIQFAKTELEKESYENLRNKQNRINSIEKKLSYIKSIFLYVDNSQNETPSVMRIINSISILFGILFFFNFYNEFSLLTFIFSDSLVIWDFSLIYYFLPIVILPIGTLLFYKRKTIGWYFLSIFLTYLSIFSLINLFISLKISQSNITILDSLIPKSLPINQVIITLFFSTILYLICQKNIRSIYSISKQMAALTIILSALFTIIIAMF